MAAMWAGRPGPPRRRAGGGRGRARRARPVREPPRPVDVLLDAFAMRFTQGYTAAAPALPAR